MWELIETIHKFLHTDSTLVFVLVVASVFGVTTGSIAYVFDKGYKNSGEYREAHKEPALAVEWHLGIAPSVYPSDGRIYMLQVWPIPAGSGGGGLGELSAPAGQKYEWPTGMQAFEFKVTNYSNEAIFNIKVDLQLEFLDVVLDPQHPNQRTSGRISLSRVWPIYISKVDPGPEHAFVFYVANFKDDVFVNISFPRSVTGRIAGDSDMRLIEVILPAASSITMLVPFVDKAHKAKQHPAP